MDELGEIREECMEEEGDEKDKLGSMQENSVAKNYISTTGEKFVVNTSTVMIVNILERLDENSTHNI